LTSCTSSRITPCAQWHWRKCKAAVASVSSTNEFAAPGRGRSHAQQFQVLRAPCTGASPVWSCHNRGMRGAFTLEPTASPTASTVFGVPLRLSRTPTAISSPLTVIRLPSMWSLVISSRNTPGIGVTGALYCTFSEAVTQYASGPAPSPSSGSAVWKNDEHAIVLRACSAPNLRVR
jgi:hypothetical protein